MNLLDYIKELERALGKQAKKNFLGMQDGDVHKTHSTELLQALTGFIPKTTLVKEYKSL